MAEKRDLNNGKKGTIVDTSQTVAVVKLMGGVGVENTEEKPPFHYETVKLAYEEATAVQARVLQSVHAIDARIIIVFLLASTALVLITTFARPSARGWPLIFWVSALPFWVVTAFYACIAFYRRSLFVGPDPKVISEEEWLKMPPVAYRYYRLRYMGASFEKNRCETNEKLDAFARSLICSSAEITLLVLAALLSSC